MNAQKLVNDTLQISLEKLFFYHQNTALIPSNILQVIQLLKDTTEFLQLVNQNNIKPDSVKLMALNQICTDISKVVVAESNPKLFNLCSDQEINEAILH